MQLLKALGGGLAFFLAVAVLEEWEVFAAALRGARPAAAALAAGDDEARRQAEDTLRRYLSLARHLYATGADPRFIDRLPATEEVVRELLDDAGYVARNHRRQEPTLMGLEVVRARTLGEGRIEAETKEYWVTRIRWLRDGGEAEPAHSGVTRVRYLLVRDGATWRVAAWDMVAGPGGGAP